MNKSDLVLRTSEAALTLGCSTDTLKRKRESQVGFLEAGVHYFYDELTEILANWLDLPTLSLEREFEGIKRRNILIIF